jgi:hypothetical protein
MTSDKTKTVRRAAGREEINCLIAAAVIAGRLVSGRAAAADAGARGGGGGAERGCGIAGFCAAFLGPTPRRIIS